MSIEYRLYVEKNLNNTQLRFIKNMCITTNTLLTCNKRPTPLTQIVIEDDYGFIPLAIYAFRLNKVEQTEPDWKLIPTIVTGTFVLLLNGETSIVRRINDVITFGE